MLVGLRGRGLVVVATLVALACAPDIVDPAADEADTATTHETETTSETTETESGLSSESEASESESESGDLMPVECLDGVQVLLGECTTDSFDEGCEGGPNLAVPVCDDLVSGPRVLGFSEGLWACGCYAPSRLIARDLDGDGADELLVPCWDGPGKLLVWPGRHDGKLACPQTHAVNGDVVWVRDVDEDGIDDLVLLGTWSPLGSWLRASSPGEYEPFVPLGPIGPTPLGGDPVELDVDGDGAPELLSATGYSSDPGPLAMWTIEAGTITVQTDAFDAPPPKQLHGVDIDGDGWNDLLASATPNWWARGSESGLGPIELLDESAELQWNVLGDVDGDGLADLVLGGNPPTVQLGLGDGSFGAPSSSPDLAAPPHAGGEVALVRDLDGDGSAEILLRAYDYGFNIWRSTNEGPRFDFNADVELPIFFTSGDFDGDGRIDLAESPPLMDSTNGQILVWRAQP